MSSTQIQKFEKQGKLSNLFNKTALILIKTRQTLQDRKLQANILPLR